MQLRYRSGVTKIVALAAIAVIVVAGIAAGVYYYLTLPPEEVESVKVGVLTYLTGPVAYGGDLFLEGVYLALDEINEGGGIQSLGGAEIEIAIYDAGFSTEETTSATRRMIMLENPSIITGWLDSTHMLPATEVMEREKIPNVVCPWADSATERGFDYIFRTMVRASVINRDSVSGVIETLEDAWGSIDKIAFVHDNNPTAIWISSTFIELEQQGLFDIVLEEQWQAPLTDATPLALKVQQSGAQMSFWCGDALTDALMIVGKFDEMGLDVPICWYGVTVMNPTFKELMGDLTEGMICLSDWNMMKGMEWLETMYLDRYGGDFMPKDAGLGYGQMWVVKEALELAGSRDPEDIRAALESMDITEGPATVLWGRVRFDDIGDQMDVFPVVGQWQGNKIETIWPEDVATAQFQPPG